MDQRIILASIYVLFPPLILLIAELNKTFLIWHIRIVDFVDLVILGPFYLVMMIIIYGSIRLDQGSKKGKRMETTKEQVMGFVFAMLFFEGHAMHMTANAIDTFSFEINDYKSTIPQDTRELIHFLDEFLGHLLLFIGLMGLIVLLLWIEIAHASNQGQELTRNENVICYALGTIYGTSMAIGAIEATYFVGFWNAYAILGLFFAYWLIKKNRERMKKLVYFKVIVAFYLTIPIATGLYWLAVGSFTQPSSL